MRCSRTALLVVLLSSAFLPSSMAADALVSSAFLPSSMAADALVSPECLGAGDAADDGGDAGRPIPGRSCRGEVGGADGADWYRLELVGPFRMDIGYCVDGLPVGAVLNVDVYWSPPWWSSPSVYQWRDVLSDGCIRYLAQYDGGLPAGTLFFRFTVEYVATAAYTLLLEPVA